MTSPRPPLPRLGAFWQTHTDMHIRPEFADLTSLIRKATKAALDFLQIDYRDFSITGCWANFNPPGGLHGAHTHPNNYLSGVYYVRTPAGVDSIDFFDPRPAAVAWLQRPRQLNRFNGNPSDGYGPARASCHLSLLAAAQRAGESHESGACQRRLQRDVHRFHRDDERHLASGQLAIPHAALPGSAHLSAPPSHTIYLALALV